MKRIFPIIISTIFAITALVLISLSLIQLEKVKHLLITNLPDAKEISTLKFSTYMIASATLSTLILFVVSVRNMLAKPKTIVEYVEKEVIQSTGEDIDKEKEKQKELEKIVTKAKVIVEDTKQTDIKTLGESFLISLSKTYDIVQGIFYIKEKDTDLYRLASSYAYYSADDSVRSFKFGHGLPGQVAMNKQLLNLKNVPQKYLTIMSGLGNSSPKHVVIFPVTYNKETIAVVEIASFTYFDSEAEKVLQQCGEELSEKCNELIGLPTEEKEISE